MSIPAVPLLWSLAANPWHLLGVEALSGFLWSGYGLASFNLLLNLAPEAQRSRFVALYQSVVFAAAFVGPFLGTAMVEATGIRPVFWVSGAGRLVAALLFIFAFQRV